MQKLVVISAAILCVSAAMAQSADQAATGAKALFFDPSSGASVSTAAPAAKTATKPISAKTSGQTAAAATNAGLMYYLELVRPSGELLRVTSNHVFHSGERVRIHFTSNVGGHITIVQRQPNGTSQVLFPDTRIHAGDNRIYPNQDTVVPGEKGWFKFDANAGEERLMVFLASDSDSNGYQNIKAGDTVSSAKTLQLASNVEQQRGSKALFVEVDEKSDSPATYVVRPASHTQSSPSAAAPATIATEIVLNHQQ